jgi:hypothetical protein
MAMPQWIRIKDVTESGELGGKTSTSKVSGRVAATEISCISGTTAQPSVVR